MKRLGGILLGLLGPLLALASPATNQATVLVVVGAAGEAEFGSNFVQQVHSWENACRRAEARMYRVGLDENSARPDRDLLHEMLANEPRVGDAPVWLVLIGHGTFDGREARFNLRGQDLTPDDLAGWLAPFERPVVLVNCASASAPFLNKLSATNRILVTATRSGSELNFARFGQFFARSIADSQSDLDKDGQVSLLEAFLSASRQVGEFYGGEGRLQTEHALLDDNGDAQGTPADWFRGIRATKKPKAGASPDGVRASQMHLLRSAAERALPAQVRSRRDTLELAVAQLREAKTRLSETEYYDQLETILLELARLLEVQQPATNQSFP